MSSEAAQRHDVQLPHGFAVLDLATVKQNVLVFAANGGGGSGCFFNVYE
jgi:hypothetical protein